MTAGEGDLWRMRAASPGDDSVSGELGERGFHPPVERRQQLPLDSCHAAPATTGRMPTGCPARYTVTTQMERSKQPRQRFARTGSRWRAMSAARSFQLSAQRQRAATIAAAVALTLSCQIAAVHAEDTAPGQIHFRGETAIGSSEGAFRRWQISRAVIDEEHPGQSEVEVVVDLTSLDTGSSVRDRHLRSDDFFGVERYPIARVRLHDFAVDDTTHISAQVDLDLHGHQRTFPMQFAVDRSTRHIVGDVTVIRSDYEIGPQGWVFNPLRIADTVEIQVDTVVPSATVATKSDTPVVSGQGHASN